MSEKEKSAFDGMTSSVNALAEAGHEGMVLAITASYLAGKEAGKREASKEGA